MRVVRYVDTDKDLATALGVSPKTLCSWRRDHRADIPHDLADGRRDIAAWKDWLLKRKSESVGSGGLRDEKLKREIVLLDIEIGQLRGGLADVDEVVSRFSRVLGDLSQRVATWRETMMAKHPELRRDIEAASNELQQMLSDAVGDK